MEGFTMLRAVKVLRKDIQDSIVPICSTTAVCAGVYFLLWVLFTFVFSSGCSVDERKDYFWMLATLFSALAPGTAYGYLNDEKGRYQYLLLPASRIEKTAAMISLSVILYPAAYILVQGAIDSLLSSAGGYSGSIWPEIFKTGQRYLLLIFIASIFLFGHLQFKSRKFGKSAIITFSAILIWGIAKRHLPTSISADAIGQSILIMTAPLLWLLTYKKLR